MAARKTINKVSELPSGRWVVKYRHDGKSTSRTFDTRDDGEAFAMDGAAFGWDRAVEVANTRDARKGTSERQRAASPSVGTYARRLAEAKPSASTRANYLARVSWIESHPLGALPIASVTTEHVEAFMRWLPLQDKKKGKGRLSSLSVAQVFDYLVQVFKAAKRADWIDADPLRGMDRPDVVDAKPMRALSSDEIRAIFAQAQDENDLAFFRFILATGVRISEAQVTTWDDVSPVDSDGFVDVHIRGTKTENADRILSMKASDLPEPIDEWDPYLFNPRRRYSQVFAAMVREAEKAGAAQAAGFEPMAYFGKDEVLANPRLLLRPTAHMLRHTHATRLFHSGSLAESAIIGRLGHQSADYSRAHYVDMSEVAARRAAGQIAAGLFADLDEG